jgi:hypothetical protein
MGLNHTCLEYNDETMICFRNQHNNVSDLSSYFVVLPPAGGVLECVIHRPHSNIKNLRSLGKAKHISFHKMSHLCGVLVLDMELMSRSAVLYYLHASSSNPYQLRLLEDPIHQHVEESPSTATSNPPFAIPRRSHLVFHYTNLDTPPLYVQDW